MVSALLQKGADVNRPVSPANPFVGDPGPPLMLAAYAESRNPDIPRLLIAAGAKPGFVSRDGETALTRAMSTGHSAIVEMLLLAGGRIAPAQQQSAIVRISDHIPDICTAVEKSLALLQKTDQQFLRQAGCKSCHNQALPAMAMNLAPTGISIQRARRSGADGGCARLNGY